MNSVVHFEMSAVDKQRVADFYTKAFDWQMQILGPEMSNYVLATTTETDEKGPKNPGAINGGFFDKNPNDPQTVHVVISVDNLEEAIEKIKQAGGTIEGEPMDIPGIGRYVSIRDTEGNRVGVLQAAPRS